MPEPPSVFDLVLANDVASLRPLLAADPGLALRADPQHGWNSLQWAVLHGFNARGDRLRAVVELLLEGSGPVDLATAALLDRPDLAADAVTARPAGVADRDSRGRTPLHVAAERGSQAVAELLLDHGADPDARDDRGETPLALAAHPGPLKPGEAREVIELLRARGATVDLHTAALLGDTTVLAALLDATPDSVDRPDAGGSTALFCAAHNLRLPAVELLLVRGADIDLARPDGQTPLSAAVDHSWDVGGPEVVARLLAAGATADLFSAAQLGLTELVVELVTAEPALLAATRYGYSVLFLACGAGHAETVAALVQLGADPNAPDPYACATSLHQAAAWGRAETCRALLAGGAEPARLNSQGQTPAMVARARGWAPVAEIIEGWAPPQR